MDLFLATLIQCCHLRVICVVSVAHSISLNTFCYIGACCLCIVYVVTPNFGLSEIRLLQLVQIQVSPRRTGVEGCTPSWGRPKIAGWCQGLPHAARSSLPTSPVGLGLLSAGCG